MSDLIARLEAATGPDRRLDVEIAVALRLVSEFHPENYIVPLEYRPHERSGWIAVFAKHPDGTLHYCHGRATPRFTGSVDAALTLIPPGWDVREADSNGGLWRVVLGRGDDNHPDYREVWSWPGDRDRGIFHRKPLALAVCIPAMKARAVDQASRETTTKRTDT